MNIVELIRDPKDVEAMKVYLKEKNLRDYAMFIVGINVALRISDLLLLTWTDVLNDKGGGFKLIKLKEGKTKKTRWIKLNRSAQEAILEYLHTLEDFSMDDFIFKSREGGNKPISSQQAFNVLKGASQAVKVEDNVGTHTLRKTWGYHAWKNGHSLALIMEKLNHSNLSITRRYL